MFLLFLESFIISLLQAQAGAIISVDGIHSNNKLIHGDPCICTDPRNCTIGGITYFHDTLTVIISSGGVSVKADVGAINFYTAVPCFGGVETIIPKDKVIPETAVAGIHKLEFWRRSGTLTNLSLKVAGGSFDVPAETFSVCTVEACIPVPPTPPIPTMSEWGLLIFGLLVLNLGVYYLIKREGMFEL